MEMTVWQFIGLAILATIALILAIQIVIQVCKYFDAKTHAFPISFSQFKALWSISTNWTLHNNYVSYKYRYECVSDSGFTYHPERTVFFYFSFPDLIRYHRFKRGIEESETKKENAYKIEAVIKQWQLDIKNFKER